MNLKDKLIALAGQVRVLSGTEDTKSLDEMTADLEAANAEIAEQTELLTAIVQSLEDKSVPAVLPSLTDPAQAAHILQGKQVLDATGEVLTGTLEPLRNAQVGYIESTAPGTLIYLQTANTHDISTVVTSLTQQNENNYTSWTHVVPNSPIVILTSGTVTISSQCELLTSGDGYYVYKYKEI